MYSAIRIISLPIALLVSACSQPSQTPLDGSWTIDGDASRLSFVSIKSGEIAEAHKFTAMTGSVSPEGAATISIDLASVETNVDVRNERLRDSLFEIATYPQAMVAVDIDPAIFSELTIGEQMVQPVSATLNLHGIDGELDTELAVTRIGSDKVQVETTSPIIVDASTFSLGEGVEALRELAGLPSISPQVPVTFSIVFEREG